MAQGSLYKKFGNSDGPGMSLVKSQQATGQAFKDVLGSISGMMDDAEKGYVEENTLNMQEYLKKNIKDSGLGADATDQTAIKQRFGSLINMDQIGETITKQERLLKETATNDASAAGQEVLANTNDPMAARKAFTQHMIDAGAPQSLIISAGNAYADSNAVAFNDAKTRKLQIGQERLNSYLDDVTAGDDPIMARKQKLLDVPESERPALDLELKAAYKQHSLLSDEQKENRARHVKIATLKGQQKVRIAEDAETQIEAQIEAAKIDGVSDSSYEFVKKQNQVIGGSVQNVLGDKVENFVESFYPGRNDRDEINGMRTRLIDVYKLEEKDADAVLFQSFQSVYSGDKLLGNNLNGKEIIDMKAKVDYLAGRVISNNGRVAELSAARLRTSQVETDVATDLTNFEATLSKAGRRVQMGVDGADNMDAVALARKNLKKVLGVPATNQTPEIIEPDDSAMVTFDPKTMNATDIVMGETINPETGEVFTKVQKALLVGKKEVPGKVNPKPEPELSNADKFKQALTGLYDSTKTSIRNEAITETNEDRALPLKIGGKKVTQAEYDIATDEVGDILVKKPAKFINNGLNWIANTLFINPGKASAKAGWSIPSTIFNLDGEWEAIEKGAKDFQQWAKAGGWNGKDLLKKEDLQEFAQENPIAAKDIAAAVVKAGDSATTGKANLQGAAGKQTAVDKIKTPATFNEFISPDSSVIDEAPLTIFAKAIKKADAPKKVTQLFKGSFANISATDEIINGTHGRNVPKSEQIGMAKMVRDNVPKEDWPQIIEQISGTNTLLAKLLAEALGLS